MKTHRLLAFALSSGLLALSFSGCSPVQPKSIARPDPAPLLAAQHGKDATVTARADTIATANAAIAQAAPAVAPQTAQIAAAVADIKTAVATAPASQVDAFAAQSASALAACDKASTAKDKTITKQSAQITAMQEDHALVTWLKIFAVLFILAAVACGFFAGYVESIPLVGPFLGKIIGPVFAGLLGALGVTCYALARFIAWTHVHPWAFGFLAFFGGGAVFIAIANHFWPTQVAAVEAKLKTYIAELEAKVGVKSAPTGTSAT